MSFLSKLHEINTFILDVDGVLTDSSLYILENGSLLRKMNTRDGFAIKHAIKQGYEVIIITGGKSQGVVKRLQGLGVKNIHAGIQRKLETLMELVEVYGLDLSRVAYMGDDMPDYECMRLAHLAACPNDAAHEIREISQYISPIDGGKGCVRDLIEKVLRVQGHWVQQKVVDLDGDV